MPWQWEPTEEIIYSASEWQGSVPSRGLGTRPAPYQQRTTNEQYTRYRYHVPIPEAEVYTTTSRASEINTFMSMALPIAFDSWLSKGRG